MKQESTKKQAPAPSRVKKGRVIDRGRNRTVDQSRQASAPKWDNVGGGVLVRAGMSQHGPHSNPIRLQGGKFQSVSYQPAPAQVEAEWVKVGEVPPPPETADLPTFAD